MRIAFMGASGTGKSFLAQKISEEFGVKLNPVGARSVALDMGFSNPYNVDHADEKKYLEWLQEHPGDYVSAVNHATNGSTLKSCRGLFQHKLQVEKIEWEDIHDSFVTDRSILDDLAYCILHDHRAVDESYIERAMAHVQIYSVIFFTSVEAFFNLNADECRVPDKTYHRLYEIILHGLLHEAGVRGKTIWVPSGENRYHWVRDVLNRIGGASRR